MRVRTLEIRWHDQKPISTCDFQPISPQRKSRLSKEKEQLGGLSYRLATGGEDNNVRIWLVRPNILPHHLATSASTSSGPPSALHPPRVEYRSTLSKHSGAVNVVRFSPNGELIASAGDDGMIIIWAPTDRPPTAIYGSEITADEDPEHWKVRISFRCTTNELYDLAWSPTGEYVIAGGTDNVARIFSIGDGTCVRELAEHNHYVQGVAWDPMNEFIATQSSDRAVHVYSISTKHGTFETHAVGKNARMHVRHSRTPSTNTSRPLSVRRSSVTSDAESAITTASEQVLREETLGLHTPSTSIASTPNMFPPPQVERSSSRRSSFSGSNAAGSPAPSSYGHFGRSPSPMPPLPAIRPQPPNISSWSLVKLYGDESFTNFFRRLTFSPDGALLLTPAGHFEDPTVILGSSSRSSSKHSGRDEPSRARKSSNDVDPSSASSVYIYTRANFARPPVAQLPGHKKASVAVKFSPVLYDLRQDLATETPMPKRVTIERGLETSVEVDVAAPAVQETPSDPDSALSLSPKKAQNPTPKHTTSSLPTPGPSLRIPSPALSPSDPLQPPTSAPIPLSTSTSVFALPYRMLFAVATMDTITIHDTQQTSPICMFTKLHYDEFTDMAWSPDGQCLMLTSRDGFCTIIVFDEHLPAFHTQQHGLQLQSLAHSIKPHQPSPVASSHATFSPTMPTLPVLHTASVPLKRSEPPFTPSSGEDSVVGPRDPGVNLEHGGDSHVRQPVKKKRRVALTRVGDLDG